jgi:hypothetical protein
MPGNTTTTSLLSCYWLHAAAQARLCSWCVIPRASKAGWPHNSVWQTYLQGA